MKVSLTKDDRMEIVRLILEDIHTTVGSMPECDEDTQEKMSVDIQIQIDLAKKVLHI